MPQPHVDDRAETTSTPLMPIQDEAYLCLLCMRDSTERIVLLYLTYIHLRLSVSRDIPPALIGMSLLLQERRNSLQDKLETHHSEKMASGLWHEFQEQSQQLSFLSEENRCLLQQICISEMRMMALMAEMMTH